MEIVKPRPVSLQTFNGDREQFIEYCFRYDIMVYPNEYQLDAKCRHCRDSNPNNLNLVKLNDYCCERCNIQNMQANETYYA